MLYNFAQFDGLRTEDIAAFATKRFMDEIQNPTRLGQTVLPFVPVDDWNIPVGKINFRAVASTIIAPDSPLPRGPLGTHSSKAYDILKGGRKYEMNESEIRKLRDVFHPGARISAQQVLTSAPYRLANALVTGYLDLAESMRWEVLSTGQYVIPNSGGVAVDYGLAGNNKATLTSTDVWSDVDDADGLDDLLTSDGLIFDETGAHASNIFMSTKALSNLLAQDSTKTKLANAGYGGIGGMVTGNTNQLGIPFFIDAVNSYLARYGVGPISIYDRKYNLNDETGATQPTLTRHLHEDRVVLVGPTPDDGGELPNVGTALGFHADGPVVENSFNPGLYVWMTEQDEPFEVAVKSVFWTLPVIKDTRCLANIRVEEAA